MQDALGLTSDRVVYWRLLLEEYGPTIVYIKGIHNTVADALSDWTMDPVGATITQHSQKHPKQPPRNP
eukprot:CCRYP_008539-RA/>CCRYP_008539-RA protein AED:0.45 eAED:0.45 QI:0/0/0/1/0/0/2/0/67